MKIKTELLQKMIAKAIQGASNNKMIPITSLIGINYSDGKLTLMTTDGSNQFRIIEKVEVPKEEDYEFYTIVNANTFSKLVGKTTKEFIELENKENYLEVKGNGTYKLEIAINEEGEMVKFPEISHISETANSVKLKELQEIIKIAKASVAKTMEVPCLTGYYIANNMIATDRQMICIVNDKLIDNPILISSEMAELLLLVESAEAIQLESKDNKLYFYTNEYEITGKELEGKETYPVQQIEGLLNTKYNNTIKINKQELLNVLDRMSLFVTDYDKGGVYLDFTEAGLIIRSQKSNAEEIVEIEGSLDPDDRFNCLADIEMLKAQIETISTDNVEIQYGQETSIKIVDGNTTHIISLLEKEN